MGPFEVLQRLERYRDQVLTGGGGVPAGVWRQRLDRLAHQVRRLMGWRP